MIRLFKSSLGNLTKILTLKDQEERDQILRDQEERDQEEKPQEWKGLEGKVREERILEWIEQKAQGWKE
jgi:hypothetical protein